METLLLVLRVGLSLSVVVVLLWLAQKRLAKGSRSGTEADLKLVGRRSVGQKASVVVVDSDGQRFLLGVTENSISVLNSGPVPVPDPAPEPAFARALHQAGAVGRGQDSPARPPRHQRSDPAGLDGSIFSANTWRQAGAAVRKGLNL